jgi:hypothetical protein
VFAQSSKRYPTSPLTGRYMATGKVTLCPTVGPRPALVLRAGRCELAVDWVELSRAGCAARERENLGQCAPRKHHGLQSRRLSPLPTAVFSAFTHRRSRCQIMTSLLSGSSTWPGIQEEASEAKKQHSRRHMSGRTNSPARRADRRALLADN